MQQRRVSELGVRLASDLRGRPLASPWRRLVAFAIDVLLLFPPSVLVAVSAAWLTLAVREPVALAALTDLVTGELGGDDERRDALAAIVPILVRYDMAGVPPAAAAAWEAGELDAAAGAIADRNLVINLFGGGNELADGQIQLDLGRLMPTGIRLASSYGVAALYFAWFTSRREGATLGKRWLGIRVVRLDNRRVELLESFERFVGYAQVPGSLFTALADFWRDPNRRLPHDRLSGTLVICR